jgi:hypothetical protein
MLAIAAFVALTVMLGSVIGRGQMPKDDAALKKDPTLQDPIDRCEKFLTNLTANNVEQSYEALLKESPLRGGKLDKVTENTKKLFALDAPYGKPSKKGIERVKTQPVGDDLVLLRYLQKFENLPVVWYFTFYRTGGRWVLITVRFDHEYELLGL